MQLDTETRQAVRWELSLRRIKVTQTQKIVAGQAETVCRSPQSLCAASLASTSSFEICAGLTPSHLHPSHSPPPFSIISRTTIFHRRVVLRYSPCDTLSSSSIIATSQTRFERPRYWGRVNLLLRHLSFAVFFVVIFTTLHRSKSCVHLPLVTESRSLI